jgi:uncharacterized protein YceH (UPF0502 family)
VELTAEEGRVLGCLVEKQLTTPQQYPLTENALLAACNQTTSRDPVVQYDVATVRLAVRSLRERDLLRTVHRSGERSEKHRHLLEETLGLSTGQQALLGLLLLRGPQTAAELRPRTERMHPFGATAEVETALQGLAERPDPLVERLERKPGQKEARYADLLVTTGLPPTLRLVPDGQPAAARQTDTEQTDGADERPPLTAGELLDVVLQVNTLRAEVAALREEVADLRNRPD